MLKKTITSAIGVALIGAAFVSPSMAGNDQNSSRGWHSEYSAPKFKFLKSRIRRFRNSHRRPIETLDDAADSSGRLVGAAINRGAFESDQQYKELLNEEFSYVTPENYAKWSLLQPNGPDEYDFGPLDAFIDNAEANDQMFKGHALVWHEQLPNFIDDTTSAAELASLSANHIDTVVTRYAGRFYSWDVVNEAVNEDGSLRNSIWLQKLGKDYIANAFYAARAADPHAQLLYNDFNIERINPKSNGVYNLVKELVDAGVPIDGVGFQMHLSAEFAPSKQQIIDNITRFTDLGLTVNVSELDVRVAKLPWDQATKLAVQKQVYHRVVDACVSVSGCEAVTTWGLTDRYSYVNIAFGPDNPLQLDEDYVRKPAYFGMIDGFVGLDADTSDLNPNLLANGSFEAGTEGWFALGDGEVSEIRSHRRFRGADSQTGRTSLESSGRTETYNGPAIDLKQLIGPNQTYDVSALGSIKGKRNDDLRITAQLQCADEQTQFVTVDSITAERREWKRLSGTFTTPDCQLDVATLYVEGPQAGVRIFVDDVSVRPQELIEAPRDDLGENLLVNGDFEAGLDGWLGYAAGSASLEEQDTFAGQGAGFAFDRSNTFDGISTELLGLVEAGKEYEFSGFVKLDNVDDSDRVIGTLFANCSDGAQFLFISAVPANDQSWTYFNGRMSIPDCDASNLTFYFEGPQAGTNFKVDNVSVREVLNLVEVENIIDAKFEGADTEGWYGFGAAMLSVTSEQAFEGSQSLLTTNRSQTFEGPAFTLTSAVVAGASYDFSAATRIRGAAAADVRTTLIVECSDSDTPQYLGVASAAASDTDWVELSGSITLPACEITNVQIYFEGPEAGIDIFVDNISLLGESQGGAGENLVSNSDFESGEIAPWGATAAETLQLVNDPTFEGAFALSAINRTETFEGPGIDLIEVTEPGQTFAISAQVRIANAVSANVNVTSRTTCADGTDVFLGGGGIEANASEWVSLSGSITTPSCDAIVQRFYFEGAAAGVDILIDNASITVQ